MKTNCSVLQVNLDKFSEVLTKHPELLASMSSGWSNAIKSSIAERGNREIKPLEIYTNISDQLKKVSQLSDNQVTGTIPILESLAVSYLGISHFTYLKPHIKNLHAKFEIFNAKIETILDELEIEKEEFELLIGVFSTNPKATSQYAEAYSSLIHSHQKLKSVPDFIRKSPLARAADFKKSSRTTDKALFVWVSSIYGLWITELNRTISNNNDGKNGRKHLLEFLALCMEPLHEAIEYETLDNMLRKVQNDFNRNGELSAFNLIGVKSSPI